MTDFSSYIEEHKELYQKLEKFLKEFTSLKNKQDDDFLFEISEQFYSYIEKLLREHFLEEEQELFPNIQEQVEPAMLKRIIGDHQEIKDKFESLKKNLEDYKLNRELDYKTQVLFPSYNLIATINHHAQREDREIFKLSLVD